MAGCEQGFSGFWWICQIFVFIMFITCIFTTRGCSCMPGRRYPGERDRRLSVESAEEILKKRYALGEIDRKQYKEMKKFIISCKNLMHSKDPRP
jgi:uncharacterized membrane protein